MEHPNPLHKTRAAVAGLFEAGHVALAAAGPSATLADAGDTLPTRPAGAGRQNPSKISRIGLIWFDPRSNSPASNGESLCAVASIHFVPSSFDKPLDKLWALSGSRNGKRSVSKWRLFAPNLPKTPETIRFNSLGFGRIRPDPPYVPLRLSDSPVSAEANEEVLAVGTETAEANGDGLVVGMETAEPIRSPISQNWFDHFDRFDSPSSFPSLRFPVSAEAIGEAPFRRAQGPELAEGMVAGMETAEPISPDFVGFSRIQPALPDCHLVTHSPWRPLFPASRFHQNYFDRFDSP